MVKVTFLISNVVRQCGLVRFHTLENTGTEDVTAVLVELNRSNETATISLFKMSYCKV